MFKINFYPESDKPELIKATRIYQKIWNNEGKKICETIEEVSGLKFREKFINAFVYEGISFSFPLRLRASYPDQIKRGTLIHELCHRLLNSNKVGIHSKGPSKDPKSPEIHKELYLILYDIWVELYGKGFANQNVKAESKRDIRYEKAFEWVLSLSKEERDKDFSKLKKYQNV